jgi:hypothetical protein
MANVVRPGHRPGQDLPQETQMTVRHFDRRQLILKKKELPMRISNSIAELRQQIHDDLRPSIPIGSRQMANLPRVIPMRRALWNSS